MAEHSNPASATDAASTTEEILAVIAVEEPHGTTAEHVARIIGRGLDGEMVQDTLEELVEWGALDRRGIGFGAVYTLNTRA